MTSHTDEFLISAIRDRDADALDTLFRRHLAGVHQLCVRLLGDAASADDVVQETFLRVMRHAGTYQGSSRVTTWLYTIARNACFDHMQREKRRIQVHSESTSQHENAADVPDSSGRIAMVNEAMRQLPPEMREALVLSRFKDLAHAEVAAVLGCSEGAARVRVHRALLRLKEIVQQMEAGYDVV